LPASSSDTPRGGAGNPLNASLFGLAPGGVYIAVMSPPRW